MKKLLLTLTLLLILPITAAAYEIDYPAGYTPYYHEGSAVALAKLIWAEGRGIASDTEKAAIAWCVLNRVDAEGCWSDDIFTVLTQPNQFAYRHSAPVDPALYDLARDVLIRWDMEKCGYEDVGRVLPKEYRYFSGDGKRNHFRTAYNGGARWGWTLVSPYVT